MRKLGLKPLAGHKWHHINALFGHPAIKGGRGAVKAMFPTAGLPARFHTNPKNLIQLSDAAHDAMHARQANLEKYLGHFLNPLGKGMANLTRGCL